MPTWTDADLKSAIEKGMIGGVTLDTSVFDGSDCNLTYKLFTSLHQFSGTGIQFLLSDVVCGEVKAHIAARAEAAATKLKAAAREFREAWRINDGDSRIMGAAGDISDAKNSSEMQMKAYQDATEFQLLKSSEFVDIDLVLNQYFEPSAPFSSSAEKKSEFPDAIALNALEAWGEKNKSFVVAVSKDKGWLNFAEQSKWIVVRGDLRKALGSFNAEDSFVAKSIIAKANSDSTIDISKEILAQIEHFVESLSPHIVAETGHYYEDEFIGASVIDVRPINIDRVAAVDSDEDEILISFDVIVEIEVEASFTFYVHDEGDSIPFASAEAAQTIELKLPFTAAVTRDIDDLSVIDIGIEASSSPNVDFGYVEPDYGDPDYDDEDPDAEVGTPDD